MEWDVQGGEGRSENKVNHKGHEGDTKSGDWKGRYVAQVYAKLG